MIMMGEIKEHFSEIKDIISRKKRCIYMERIMLHDASG